MCCEFQVLVLDVYQCLKLNVVLQVMLFFFFFFSCSSKCLYIVFGYWVVNVGGARFCHSCFITSALTMKWTLWIGLQLWCMHVKPLAMQVCLTNMNLPGFKFIHLPQAYRDITGKCLFLIIFQNFGLVSLK